MKNNVLRKILKCLAVILAVSCIFVLTSDSAFSRPGGGHGFSGGRGFGGGGFRGGGFRGGYSGGISGGYPIFNTGDYDTDYLLTVLAFILVSVITYPLYKTFSERNKEFYDEKYGAKPTEEILKKNRGSLNSRLKRLIQSDPEFSKPIFLDYAVMLYNKYYISQGTAKMKEQIIPFFKDSCLPKEIKKYSEITIGVADIKNIEFKNDKCNIHVGFIASYTCKNAVNNKAFRYNVTEEWIFSRKNGVLTHKPEGFGILRCPNCGGALEFSDCGKCKHCGTKINFQAGQWIVSRISVMSFEKITAEELLTYCEESGTNYPTVCNDNINELEKQFSLAHFELYKNFKEFSQKVVIPYFQEIYKHWSEGEWDKARHLLSDRLWNNYEINQNQYKEFGYFNRLKNVHIIKIHTVNYETDKNYEAVTVRIYAKCLDYIEDSLGNLIAGDNEIERSFSEYWTFVANKNAKLQDRDLAKCPSCGAPIEKIGNSGICEYCNCKITDGNFSWVLFSITQDEVYTG